MIHLLEAPTLSAAPDVDLLPVRDSLWRVVDGAGRALGHIEVTQEAAGPRFRARRFHPSSATLRPIGDFWTATEAVECLRHLT